MNTRLKPPCMVMFDGRKYGLRSISPANARMKKRGWKGLVAHLNGYGGATIAEYRKLEAVK